MTEEVLDAEVVDEQGDDKPDANDTDTAKAMVAVPARQGVIAPLDPQEVVESFRAYQELLPRLLSASDWQEAGRGKSFVKKSGWRKIAKAFGLSTEIVRQKIERNEEGMPIRASVIVRALHGPTGQYADGDGHCSYSEDRFSGSRGNTSKLENDLTATATTRAKNRAISDLVGMGDVSAEEVAAGPPYGDEATGDLKKAASAALVALLGESAPDAEAVWGEIKTDCQGYMPEIVAQALITIATTREVNEQDAAA